MITLHKLRLFMVVCDRGSFNQAAQELYLAQSVVSQHVQSLETALGTPLFIRSARGVQPTKAGEMLYKYAGQMLALLAEAERTIMQLNQALPQQLVIGSTPGISVYLLTAWLHQFQQMHPTVQVALQTVLTGEVVRDVLNGRYHLGLLEGDLDELDQEALGKMRLRDIEYSVIVNAQHPLAQQGTLSPQELSQQPFINRLPSSRARLWLDRIFSERGVQLRTIAELDSPGAIKYALLNQMGVGILPDYVVEREIERGELYRLALTGLELKRPLMLVWDKRQPFNALQRAFISLPAIEAPQLQMLLYWHNFN
jgi:DNA-binding transcriptional LysR family regulator